VTRFGFRCGRDLLFGQLSIRQERVEAPHCAGVLAQRRRVDCRDLLGAQVTVGSGQPRAVPDKKAKLLAGKVVFRAGGWVCDMEVTICEFSFFVA
jgi:hypothetical protein